MTTASLPRRGDAPLAKTRPTTAGAPAPPPTEKRRLPRLRFELVTCDLRYVRDLSGSGMRITRRLRRGEHIHQTGQTLVVSLGVLHADLAVEVRVMWSDP